MIIHNLYWIINSNTCQALFPNIYYSVAVVNYYLIVSYKQAGTCIKCEDRSVRKEYGTAQLGEEGQLTLMLNLCVTKLLIYHLHPPPHQPQKHTDNLHHNGMETEITLQG